MRIKVLYEGNTFVSKNIDLSEFETVDFAEGLFQSIHSMDKLKLETPDGWIIFPEEILKKSVIFVDK